VSCYSLLNLINHVSVSLDEPYAHEIFNCHKKITKDGEKEQKRLEKEAKKAREELLRWQEAQNLRRSRRFLQ
jgi:hypothetical protein